MELYLLDTVTTLLIVITFLLTDNKFIIIITLIIITLFYDYRGVETPIVTLPKILLGRNKLGHGINIISSQILGMLLALIIYKLSVKYELIIKHKLE